MSRVDWRGQTTLVTGASAGIGAEFARQLAARGSHLVLVARRADRLAGLAAELTAAHGVTARVVPLDLARPAAGRALAAEVDRQGIAVTSVVNCAGFGTHGPFAGEDADRLAEEIAVDVTALVDVSRAFIDRLRAGSGVLVNVASMAAYVPSPDMAVYAASKAFVLSFTEALWQESLDSGLRVLALSPGATDTEFFDVLGNDAADGGRGRQSPQEVVATAFRALDRRDPPPSVAVGRANRASVRAVRLLTRRRAVLLMAAITGRAAEDGMARRAAA
ncbi:MULTISPECIES: SDR family NAD(P)-dependent oxidoreductase [unclassified Modestobacter]|uniref:SDR family NAD(P)-dependent oxidoreductase n=1 Tax=unclassified Modestobacter TaxID=2643866 RepID=UPI0022AA612A|nr:MULTISPECIES: SDR family NAD(P)-dependent oxidoreductase [unclassified Modestobacter]MCZ2825708.1 SDR family NAD(P)-dependent oxidoreductase [Modestobacter sp. VKM Ac-2981]MCZ2853227.1 SDR family NAD(P)-dependent oxidoreductase [Modestobacter sp. VKM Ac-2982]